jgi:Papain-like cysteine protease AvrRpt2
MPLRVKTGVPITAPPPTAVGPAEAAAVGGATLNVPLVAQTQNQWCWAACTAMIAKFLGMAEPGQCELANFLFGRTNCCTAPGSAQCNRPAQTAEVVQVYNHLGIKLVGPDNPLWPNTVKMELDAGRPFEVGLLWNGGGGHVVIVYGYTAQGLVLVRDPWFGNLSITYNRLFTAYGMGRWFVSYGRFTRSG